MADGLNRRSFLRTMAALSALPLAGLAPTAGGSPNGHRGRGCGRRVVVLGAGVGGLAAAHRLVESGYDVTVLEAQERPGGARTDRARALPARRARRDGGCAGLREA
jgi:hypothetical protein